jgi:hypothetical protein
MMAMTAAQAAALVHDEDALDLGLGEPLAWM